MLHSSHVQVNHIYALTKNGSKDLVGVLVLPDVFVVAAERALELEVMWC